MRVILLLLLATLGQAAAAFDLSVRLSPAGHYEAVLSADLPGCGPGITEAESISIDSGQIIIIGYDFGPVVCPLPPPGYHQTVITPLGHLVPGLYQLAWSQPNFFSVSTTFVVPAQPPASIPFASPVTLAILGILVLLSALLPNYVFNRTVGDMLRSNQSISALGRLARR